MTLDQLRIFVAVAEREHMTAAARALNITQSAASAAIGALEDRHAVKLFHRVGRGIALTETGQLFLGEARAVLARAAAAVAMLDDVNGLKRGTLRLVASQTIAAYWLPSRLSAFSARYPALHLDVAICNTEQAAERVAEGLADLGIVEGEVDHVELVHWPMGQDRLVLVQAKSGPSATVNVPWLRAARWVLREVGSGTRSTLDDRLRQLGVQPETLTTALVLPSNESVRTAVEAGAGVAALSELVVAPALAAGTLQALPLDFGPRPFHGLRHKERHPSRATQAFLELVTEMGT